MKINFKLKGKKINIFDKVNIEKYKENKVNNENIDNENINKEKTNNKKIDKYKVKYYTLFIFMILLSVVTIKTNIKLNENLNEESYLVFNSEDKIYDYQDNNCNNKDTRFKDVINVINSNNLNKNIDKVKVNKEKVNKEKVDEKKELKFIKPLSGKIIKDYSEDLVYSNTLDMWKIHDGIDIEGKLNTSIIAIEDGIVERKFEDSFYGNTLIIKHIDGYKSIYSNISSKLNINDKISKYQVIGKLDNSGVGEFKDNYHLHFMMKFNDKIINPNKVIKF